MPLLVFVRGVCQNAGLCHIWSQNICIVDQILHMVTHLSGVGWIRSAVIAHNGVNDHQVVRTFEIPDKIRYNSDLSGRAEESGADTGKGQIKLLPFVDAWLHMVCIVLIVEALKSCMIGKNGCGKCTALNTKHGDDRKSHCNRAAAKSCHVID